MSQIHSAAAQGFQSGAAAYERGRPDYPAEVAAWLTGTLGIGPGKTVLDLGAGTGKFTADLVAAGAAVVAVEPVDAMRERLAAALPAVEALSGTAASIPLPDGSVDALVCAQAFHWFATKAALDEITRVLRPGGKFGLIWNMRDESEPWVAALTEIITPYEGSAPRAYKGTWKAAFPHPNLSPLVEAQFPHGHTGTIKDVILNRTRSISFIAKLLETERETIIDRVRALVAQTPSLAGKAEVTFPYVTFAYSAQRV